MPKSTTITKEVILEITFEMVRKEGFAVLSARNIARQIGCSTQPIYWCYKNMGDLKTEICKKALPYLQNIMLSYSKTDNAFLDLGLGYVRIAYIEPALFKAFYMDNAVGVKECIKAQKAKYRDARHVVHAFVIGKMNIVKRRQRFAFRLRLRSRHGRERIAE